MSRDQGWDSSDDDRAVFQHPNVTMNLGSHGNGPGIARGPGGSAAAYRLGTRLGRAGEVYEADHPGVQGRIALKAYRRATGVDATVTEAFCRDAMRASGLRHPHIAHVVEAGTFVDGTPFMAVEFLKGETLEERMVGRGAFLATELLPLIRGAASALSAAHAAAICHRELRPDNIFIADLSGYEQGFVKLLDFGVCHLTAAQIAGGRDLGLRTTRYFAPEQMAGALADADARSDQFALAAIAYRMLNGTDPQVIQGSSHGGRGTQGRAGHLSTLARRAPAVDAVVSKGLSRYAEDRFESVALFLRAFEEALTGAALISTPGPVRQPTDPVHAAAVHVVPPPRPRYPTPLADVPGSNEIDPGSLSNRFFAEGEHQEATRFKNLPHADDSGPSDAHLEFDSFDRIPTRRKPLIIALLILIVGAAGAAWWAGVRPPEALQQSALWQRLRLPHMPPPAAPVRTPAAPEPISPTALPRVTAPVSPVAPAAVGQVPVAPAPTPPAVEAPAAAPAPVRAAEAPPGNSAATALPAELPPPAAVGPTVSPEPEPTAKRSMPAAAAESAGGGPAVVVPIKPNAEKKRPRAPSRSETSRHFPPLMLWSPKKQAMVPADEVGGGESSFPGN